MKIWMVLSNQPRLILVLAILSNLLKINKKITKKKEDRLLCQAINIQSLSLFRKKIKILIKLILMKMNNKCRTAVAVKYTK